MSWSLRTLLVTIAGRASDRPRTSHRSGRAGDLPSRECRPRVVVVIVRGASSFTRRCSAAITDLQRAGGSTLRHDERQEMRASKLPSSKNAKELRSATRPDARRGGCTRCSVERHRSFVQRAIRSPRLTMRASASGITGVHAPAESNNCNPSTWSASRIVTMPVAVGAHAELGDLQLVAASRRVVVRPQQRGRVIGEGLEVAVVESERPRADRSEAMGELFYDGEVGDHGRVEAAELRPSTSGPKLKASKRSDGDETPSEYASDSDSDFGGASPRFSDARDGRSAGFSSIASANSDAIAIRRSEITASSTPWPAI